MRRCARPVAASWHLTSLAAPRNPAAEWYTETVIGPSSVFRFRRARQFVQDLHRVERYPFLLKLYADYRVSRYEHEIAEHGLSTDVFVISYPKSGRTWHRFLLGNYLAGVLGLPLSEAAGVEKITAAMPGMAMRYSHNGANFVDPIPATHPIVADPRLWTGKRVIFLARDPKDVLVSAWFHAKHRQSSYSGPISDFVRSKYTGIEKLLVAHNRWWEHRHRASSFMVTTYEEMHQNLEGVLYQTLSFLGHTTCDAGLVARAIEASSFENMREAERKTTVAHKSMRALSTTKNASDKNARKVRQGRVGGYTQHLSPDDVAFIDTATARLGNPFASLEKLRS